MSPKLCHSSATKMHDVRVLQNHVEPSLMSSDLFYKEKLIIPSKIKDSAHVRIKENTENMYYK